MIEAVRPIVEYDRPVAEVAERPCVSVRSVYEGASVRATARVLTIREAKNLPLAGFLFALTARISRPAAAPHPASA